MKKGFFLITFCVFFFINSANASELLSVNFYQSGEISNLELVFSDADFKFDKFHNNNDKQVLLDLKGVSAGKKVLREFDTSEFSGSMIFVRGYQKEKSKDELRIAVQLRDNVRSIVQKNDKKVLLSIENRFGAFSQQEISNNTLSKKHEDDLLLGNASGAPSKGQEFGVSVPKSDAIEDILQNLTMSGKKKYIGKRITMNVVDARVEDILKMIADASGFSVIITDEIKKLPTLTLNLTNVPWDQILDTVLGINKLVATKNGTILMLTTLDKATQERKLEEEAERLSLAQEPLVTRLFPISFAKLKELEPIAKEYLTKERGSLMMDERTNSLIIKDTASNVEKIKKIIELLDAQTPQVLIQAKIVEVKEDYAKNIGLTNGLSFGYDPIGIPTTGNAPVMPFGEAVATPRPKYAGPGFAFNSASNYGGGASNTAMNLTISQFSRLSNLNFLLNLMESESKAKIVSSPRIITQNKKAADITNTNTQYFLIRTNTDGQVTESYTPIEATLKLSVTPQITNDGSILMEINLQKDDFAAQTTDSAPPPLESRTVKTNVLVDNGSTIVIGGIYSSSQQENHRGIVFLKDLPLVGWLFRSPYNPTSVRRELVMFLTPRIINQEEAGLVQRDEDLKKL